MSKSLDLLRKMNEDYYVCKHATTHRGSQDQYCSVGCNKTTRGPIKVDALCPWSIDSEWYAAFDECDCYSQ